MNHEPECDWSTEWPAHLACEGHEFAKYKGNIFEDFSYCYKCEAPCTCRFIRAGYLRGIRDASVTVRYLVDKFEADTVQRGDK